MITYIDTYNNNGLTYEDYKEFCDINGIEPATEDSNNFYEWAGMENTFIWNDLKEELQHSKLNGPVSVCGSPGLWWGRPTIEPKKFKSIWDAIVACTQNADDIIITLEKGILKVQALHHDGRNIFTIHRERGYFWPKYLF